MYQVRVKKYEKRNWKVVAEYPTEREATKAAIQLEMSFRRKFDTMYDHVDVKYPDGSRFVFA